jgi:FixJ family two-component response regulator
MDKPGVWVVDADHWPRAELRALLIERGYDAMGIETLADAVLRARLPGAALPAAIVVDLAAQDAGEALVAALFATHVPVIAIGGALEWEQPSGHGGGWAAFLRRPVTLGDIADAVARALRGS